MFSNVSVLTIPAFLLVAGCAATSKRDLAAEAPVAQSASPASTVSLDVPVEQIAATERGCAILDQDFPGMRQHPMYPYFKTMTLNQLAALSKGQITHEMMARAQIDLAKLKTAVAPATTVSASVP